MVKEASGAGGYAPGDLVVDRCVSVSAQASRGRSVDGAQWIIEAVSGGNYHLVDRWKGGDLREGTLLLVKYSGITVEAVY